MEDGERSEPSEHECPQGSPVEWLGERSEPNREHRTGLVCSLVAHPGHCITEEAEGPEGAGGLEVIQWPGWPQVSGFLMPEGPEGARKAQKA